MKLKIICFALALGISSIGFSQESSRISEGKSAGRQISLLNNKIEFTSPKLLTEMSDKMWEIKDQQRPRPVLALSDENGEVSLIGDLTQQSAAESQLASFKDFQISQL